MSRLDSLPLEVVDRIIQLAGASPAFDMTLFYWLESPIVNDCILRLEASKVFFCTVTEVEEWLGRREAGEKRITREIILADAALEAAIAKEVLRSCSVGSLRSVQLVGSYATAIDPSILEEPNLDRSSPSF